jgi:27-O-demethylrifamycin SV methyltransferase
MVDGMDATAPTTDEIGQMYDESAELSQMFIDGQEHLPYWYDDQDDTPVVMAAQRITRKVAVAVGLQRGERVLDAGCGVGAPAVLLADEYGVQVTGITVSHAQVAAARQRAAASGAADRATFQHGDYLSLDFPAGSFDAIVAIESLMHAPDLGRGLSELFRVLRPGGRLGLADCTKQARLGSEQAEQFATTFRINQLHSVTGWVELLTAAGFRVEEYTQCGPRVYGMGLRYLDRAEALHDELVSRFGQQAIEELRQSYRDYFGWGTDIGYAIIAARKPRS